MPLLIQEVKRFETFLPWVKLHILLVRIYRTPLHHILITFLKYILFLCHGKFLPVSVSNTIIKICKCLPLSISLRPCHLILEFQNKLMVLVHVKSTWILPCFFIYLWGNLTRFNTCYSCRYTQSINVKTLNFLSPINFLKSTFFCWSESSQDLMRSSVSPYSVPSFLKMMLCSSSQQ